MKYKSQLLSFLSPYSTLVIILFLMVWHGLLMDAEYSQIRVKIETKSKIMTPEIEKLLLKGDAITAQKILWDFKENSVANIALTPLINKALLENTIFSGNDSKYFFKLKSELIIENNGLVVGKLNYNISPFDLSLSVAKKNLLSYLMVTVFILAMLFLNSFSTLKILNVFEETLMRVATSALDENTIKKSIDDLEKVNTFNSQMTIISFKKILHEILDFIKIKTELEKAKSMTEVAKQVSHDIRSPLSALLSIANQLQNVPENQRLILRTSTNRISDIANTLLAKAKEQKTQTITEPSSSKEPLKFTIELLPALVDSIVSEKRVQFRDKIGVEIESELNDSYGAFAAVNVTELQRLLSNTINNAVESLPENKGKITLGLSLSQSSVILTVADTGKGIPQHILDKLGQQGVTHGKEGTQSGSGLGVYHAKKTIESFSGELKIETKEGKGTKIEMILPRAATPKWFVDKILLPPKQQVISLDDDFSIHGIWKSRFDSLRQNSIEISHFTFTSGMDFKHWYAANAEQKENQIYLIDYELINQPMTGLQIIEELGIGANAILVTSRYEESGIRVSCEKLGVRLIPKSMAGFVPIQVEKPKEHYDAILVDDDIAIVHMMWTMSANSNNKILKTFSTPDEFLNNLSFFDSNTPIYVDSNLGNDVRGEKVSKMIFELGFKNIWLCTGYNAADFPPMPWLKGIVGKEPPWG